MAPFHRAQEIGIGMDGVADAEGAGSGGAKRKVCREKKYFDQGPKRVKWLDKVPDQDMQVRNQIRLSINMV